MLTQCPNCATSFRVSPQQLKVHQGEVRCGRCTTVFDAFASLIADPAASAAEQGQAPVPTESAAASSPAAEFSHDDGDASATRAGTEAPPPLARTLRTGAGGHPSAADGEQAAPAVFSFGAKASPRARWVWAVLGIAAAAALVAQMAYQYRSELAVMWPESRPWLERACAEIRCTVALPRHVELVSIDASDLQLDTAHANLMLLTATLRNRAPFAQEHPALALTLTDTADQPLARRVLAAADYLERKADGKSGFPANAEIAIRVFVDSHEVKAAGYRLFLFYP